MFGMGDGLFLNGFFNYKGHKKQAKAINKQTKSNERIASVDRFNNNLNQGLNRQLEQKRIKQEQEQFEIDNENKAMQRKQDLIIALLNNGKSLDEATKEVEQYLYQEEQNKIWQEEQAEREFQEHMQEVNKKNFKFGVKLLFGILLTPFILIICVMMCTIFR